MTHEFDAVIKQGRGGGALVEIPFSVQESYDTRGHGRAETRTRRLAEALEKLARGEKL